MAVSNQREDGWTVVVRRQPAHVVDGAEGPCTALILGAYLTVSALIRRG